MQKTPSTPANFHLIQLQLHSSRTSRMLTTNTRQVKRNTLSLLQNYRKRASSVVSDAVYVAQLLWMDEYCTNNAFAASGDPSPVPSGSACKCSTTGDRWRQSAQQTETAFSPDPIKEHQTRGQAEKSEPGGSNRHLLHPMAPTAATARKQQAIFL